MTARRNIIIAISAIVVFAAIVGFFITLDVSPQIAYARLFIDAGLVIGLIAVVMAFYRERELPIDSIINALATLKTGKFKTRLPEDSKSPLNEIVLSINALAVSLEEQQEKQEEIKRSLREELLPNLKQREFALEHSYHPELGPVRSIAISNEPVATDTLRDFREVADLHTILTTRPPKIADQRLENTLIDSKPPKANFNVKLELERQDQDLGELYQRFIDAQKAFNQEQIEYALFLRTIEKTRQDLMSSYKCHGIFFDIVNEAGQVALQPKIIR